MSKTFQFRTCLDEDVFGDPKTAETAMGALSATDRRFIALANDHQQVEIAPFIWLSPGVGAKQPYFSG